jgi:hypothetical protein
MIGGDTKYNSCTGSTPHELLDTLAGAANPTALASFSVPPVTVPVGLIRRTERLTVFR